MNSVFISLCTTIILVYQYTCVITLRLASSENEKYVYVFAKKRLLGNSDKVCRNSASINSMGGFFPIEDERIVVY